MDNIISNNKFLNNKQVKKLNKLNKNKDIILNTQTKIIEKKRITNNLKELKLLNEELKHSTEKKIIESLNLNKYNSENKGSLYKMKDFKLNMSYNTSFYKNYINDLFNSNNIDFSLFYYGNKKDILNVISDSFIDFKSNNNVQLRYKKDMSELERLDFINLGIKHKILLNKRIPKDALRKLYDNLDIPKKLANVDIENRIYKNNELLEYLFNTSNNNTKQLPILSY